MKHLLIIMVLLLCVNFSCSSLATETNAKGYRILKTEKLKTFKLITFANSVDTILGVTEKDVSEKCISKQLINFQIEKHTELEKLNDKGDTIYFHYRIKTVNGGNAYAGSGAPCPPDKIYIYSYKSYPILLKKCE